MKNMNADIIGNIYRTNDYSRFKTIIGNRAVDKKRIAKIEESIVKIGFRMCPIVVNNKMEIIDGQGRFESLKSLGLPILYVVDEGADIEVCRQLNIHQENWKTIDYIKSYAESGVDDYVRLLMFVDMYKQNFNLKTIISTCSHCATCCTGQSNFKLIEKGDFKFFGKDQTRKDEFEYLKRFSVFKEIGGSYEYFFGAVLFAYRYTSVDRERLFNKIDESRDRMYKVCDVDGALKLLTEIYNSHISKGRVYIDHEYKTIVRDSKRWIDLLKQ